MLCASCGLPILDQRWFRCTCGSDSQVHCFSCVATDPLHHSHTFLCVTPITPAGRRVKICAGCKVLLYDRVFVCDDVAVPVCQACLGEHVSALHSARSLPVVMAEDVPSGKISPTKIDIQWPDASTQPQWELATRDEERTFMQTIDLLTKQYRELETKYRNARVTIDELLEESGLYDLVSDRDL